MSYRTPRDSTGLTCDGAGASADGAKTFRNASCLEVSPPFTPFSTVASDLSATAVSAALGTIRLRYSCRLSFFVLVGLGDAGIEAEFTTDATNADIGVCPGPEAGEVCRGELEPFDGFGTGTCRLSRDGRTPFAAGLSAVLALSNGFCGGWGCCS